MNITIYSRKLSREITISRPGKYYLYADLNGQPGTLGNQICDGGHTSGNTISYSGDEAEEFEKIARRWYKSYIANIGPWVV